MYRHINLETLVFSLKYYPILIVPRWAPTLKLQRAGDLGGGIVVCAGFDVDRREDFYATLKSDELVNMVGNGDKKALPFFVPNPE